MRSMKKMARMESTIYHRHSGHQITVSSQKNSFSDLNKEVLENLDLSYVADALVRTCFRQETSFRNKIFTAVIYWFATLNLRDDCLRIARIQECVLKTISPAATVCLP
eukprot:Protomagalhaensia_wolfi_Nauph_80__1454@NODE_1878_length_1292_cov_53_355946_g1467_i0_p2_GENE_NODE_1878_length_1292_cov_53_355946_g1467_i0NODE_1878_length_1292_cov_53_355946_g1467_i0_p2_ORF_typecomplete_len108_score0_50Zot/PF05707_12/0_12_NODE_1878_length_1292_cov_53_355946_g1467_i07241047